ncbi:retrovirus-related pol polyprotein from transposon TNT 1-94 [Tanacetum coccineum]|uniref:Retrovirus-related pol polyprotein from transposon TNT 1-94 n=1 Tax=Tanacetum coccineum TaxID=301880 RepID=A0ABQ5G6D6_9ASTR
MAACSKIVHQLGTMKIFLSGDHVFHANKCKIHLALRSGCSPHLHSDNYYQAPKPQRTNTTSSSTRPSASTRHKGKEIAKPVTPQSESVSEEDSDPEQAQRDKDMQKNLALLAKYFKRLYKPTNNNLRTSSNSRNKTEDTTPRYNNDNQSGQFGNQRTMTVAGARETVGSQVVQQNGIQCFNCKGFGHYAKECRKPKRVKDYSYHKEKMMMCKQAEQGVPLQAEQADWLADTDEEIDEQELEAHYSFMAKIQEVLPEESSSTEQPLEQVQNNDENNVFANERQHSENNTAECADERAALANLIANLTLDTEENKTILKQLKKANASLTQELEECKTNLDETSRALGEATSCRDSCLIALQNKQNELEKYIAFNDRTIDYEILQTKLNDTLGLLALKDIEIKEGLKTKAYEISVLNQKHDELVKKSLLTKSQLEGYLKEKTKVISDLKVKEEKDIDKMIEMDKQLKFLNEIVIMIFSDRKCSLFSGVMFNTVSIVEQINTTMLARPQLKCYQVKDKVVPNNSQVKFKKKEVEDHHRISSISKKTKSVTACNDSSKSRTLNVNDVCAECGKCVFNSNHDACVSRYLNDVNARTKKPKVVPISASKPKRKANKSVATPHKKTVASDTTIQKSKSYYKELYENTNQEWKWWIAKKCPSGYKWTQKPHRTKKIWMPKIRKEDVSTSISPTIDIVSRITNVLKISNSLGSNLSNVPSSSNSLADCTTHPIHCTIRFGNDQFAPILGYGDLNQGNVMIKRVYYVEGLNHNLFLVGQFCDADLEVAFRKSTCFVRDLQGNDLLTGNRGSDLYTISLQETTSLTPICFMAKASPTQAWLWHRRLSHLNFDYITLLSKKDIVTGLPKLKYVKDQLCSSCEMSKAKRSSFKSKVVPSSKGRLNLLHMDLCGPMRVASINGKKYILVIVDDYSRYTWTLFLRSKDETPEVLKDFLTMIQRNLQAQVISVRTDRGTEFLNKTLHAYFKEEGIEHQTSTPRTPEQNGVVERRNRTLVEAARTMLSASKLPLSFWAEAVATACYTQNRSIIISTHGKTAYHIINDRKPSIKHLHIFASFLKDKRHQIMTTLAPCPQDKMLFLQPEKTDSSHQGTEASFQEVEFINPILYFGYKTLVRSSSRNIANTDVHSFSTTSHDLPMDHVISIWKQVRGNPTMPVQTRQQLATYPEMCMFALTVSIVEPKNIKEAMADSAWIEAMQDELHQFDD